MALCAMILVGSGCAGARKRTTHQRVVTGLFGNRLDTLMTNFARIKERETTREELRGMGFTLEKVPNMKVFEGVPAFEELFGKEWSRNIDPQKIPELLQELGLYTLYQIPYKNVTNTADRIYMNRQKIQVQGPDAMFTIIARDGKVVYAKKNLLYNNTVEYRKRIGGGLIDFLGEVGGAVNTGVRAAGGF